MAKLTLFGVAGTGKSTLAELFAKRNGYEFMSTGNIFREMGKEKAMNVYEFNKYCETHPEQDKILDERVKKYGQEHNNFIFESRLAWFFIPDSIKIKLICDIDERVRRVSQRDLDNLEEVKLKTIKREESEKTRYKELYNIDDYTKDSNYDLILDSTNKSPEILCKEIEEYLKSKKTTKK